MEMWTGWFIITEMEPFFPEVVISEIAHAPCMVEQGACYNPSVRQVPKVGIEPTLPKEHDFESCASACSATSACCVNYNGNFIIVNAYTFQTERLKLRPFEAEDAAGLRACLNHPDLADRRYLPRGFPENLPLSTAQVGILLKNWGESERNIHLALIQRSDQALIGYAAFDWGWDPHCPFLSIVISPQHQRQGFALEVLSLLLNYVFENTVAHNVSSWMADWNQPARAFARKHDFKESGCSRREGLRMGAYYDAILVDILRPEWFALQES